MLSVRQIREKAGEKSGILHKLNCCDTPAEIPLVSYAGVEGDLVASGRGGAAAVRLADLFHTGDGIGAGPELGCQDDRITLPQRVNLTEIRVGSSVV